ncbi:uncharacterized protein SPPG_01746 [Spizellomyces punctatus DAOM BR117]|uniref:Uncharacterized protein n=1 Tax=Spizellomyces punctatus (strain DAOM BR117) TaxID=645134 RepID=A0A0L0HNY7_SPIPD|nr:uncharacterized protein SPPG_01746 [Spizellomyces punctatus DAOM BR117]KND02660.1 hypothetical protein SPPG_01746 [Spizellomyces punctatus DAOM BR117]|eukprot:XP_016610699.1 hypothetical protein SPPG_01746 [Spizellomyces punctatus DAOM BR117]
MEQPGNGAAVSAVSRHDENILNLIFNPDSGLALDDEPLLGNATTLPAIDSMTLTRLKMIEQEAVILAEHNDLVGSIDKLNECISLCPEYASAYNNRAQAFRLKGQVKEALEDLERALEYGVGNASVLKQAYTQRAIIRKSQGDAAGAESDFAQGARYGNEVAKAAVRNNPYAKMCNAMVMEAMTKLGA